MKSAMLAIPSTWTRCAADGMLYLLRVAAQGGDAITGRRMRGEEAAAAGPFGVEKPGQRILHGLGRITGALEQLGAVRVRLILLVPAIRARDQRARDRREIARARDDLVEDDHADGEAGLQTLGLRHVTQVVVRHLVGEHAGQL